ncbi:KH domain-containing protein [Candidatus Gracilibacteria bacterium]|nr:KH domain-containing protein [Candidatus Gracilibacteria bacterium]
MNEIQFLDYIVKSIVTNKDAVKIERKEDELGVLLTLSLDKADMGTVIGKGGNTINSIRTLVRIFGLQIDKKINIKVLD